MERSSTLARKTQHKVKNGLRLAVTYLFLGLLGLVMVYPLLWMVASSFKESKGIFNSISIIPPSLSLEHYIEGWKGVGGIYLHHLFHQYIFHRHSLHSVHHRLLSAGGVWVRPF
jgi:transporter